jgi:hypothetical protein
VITRALATLRPAAAEVEAAQKGSVDFAALEEVPELALR